MLSELLEDVKRLATEAAAPVLLPTPQGAEPSIARLYNPKDKSVTEITVLPPDRKHSVLTLDSLASAIKSYGKDVTLWCNMDRIESVLDDGVTSVIDTSFRRDRVSFAISQSWMFNLLRGISGKPLDQKALYKLLTHDIANSFVAPANFTTVISNLKFASSQEIDGQVSAVGKNTLGRKTMSEVTGAEKLPEHVTFEFEPWPHSRIWAGLDGPTVTVKCSVWVDSVEGKITISVQPGQIEEAQAQALDELRSHVAEKTGIKFDRVLAGTP